VNEVFTVVVTEQEHLDSIREYKAFLRPFLENSQVEFCRWRTDGACLGEAVPELVQTVSRHDRWRMIVVCDEEGLERKNPFELVSYTPPEWPRETDQETYLQLVQKAKFAAFEEAAKKPLTRLMTWLCQSPTVTEGINNAQADPEFAEYVAEMQKKMELRQQIMGDEVSRISLPAEIICVAKRCYVQTEYDIQVSWETRQDSQYSRFYDWNLYFDKMRYLIFDMLPKTHRNYTFDYIRFLYALLLLADNETPQSALNPNRVYTYSCINDEEALRRLLGGFDAKLASTQELIRGEIRKLEQARKPRLTDRDAEMIFCSRINVPVAVSSEFDRSTLYMLREKIGLSGDCPVREDHAWDDGYVESTRALSKFMKLPRRALQRSLVDLHRMSTADLDEAGRLNDFQLEDVADHVDAEELRMISTRTMDLYDLEQHTDVLEAQNKRMVTQIERRMPKALTIGVGVTALLVYLAGFIPLLADNHAGKNQLLMALAIAGGGLLLLGLTAFVTLFFLRRPIRVGYSDYNGLMKGIVDETDNALDDYSKYLSHACNVMRGNSVLNYRKETEDPCKFSIRIMNKHLFDLQRTRAELKDVFGQFLPKANPETDPDNCYSYDFTRPVDFSYPIPFSAEQKTTIEFLQKGNQVQVPVDFVRVVTIRREDLYD
jgi:hypothetical protein